MSDRKMIWSDFLGYVGVAVVALLYIGTAMFVPTASGKSIGTILADGALGFALGVAINFNLNLQGILKGKNAPQMLLTREEHGKTVDRIARHIHRLDGWCADQNAEALRRERSRILIAAGLRYEDHFDEDGKAIEVVFTGDKDVVKLRRKAWRAALRVKLTPLSTASLTGDGERQGDPFNFGENPEQYQRRTNLTDVGSKIVMAVVFGYFGVDMIADFHFEELAWRALYVAILLAFGIAKLLRSYLFMVDTYRGGIVKKINYLQSFENWAAESPEGDKDEFGKLQDRAAESAGGTENESQGTGGAEPSEAAQIPAPAHGGAEPWHDRKRQNCRV
ncbi:MAG: hypothetical protein E7590_07445 [Ruminococcaceae bacterium]|nr:hypothetical protein [Oscillospiraceae bacterium]MBE6701909.1 hypothetical protein [Oscillospiraceae bacterium]